MDQYAPYFTEFFAAHPEYLDQVRYLPESGSDEPALFLRTSAMEAFVRWACDKGYVRHPDRAHEMLHLMRTREKDI